MNNYLLLNPFVIRFYLSVVSHPRNQIIGSLFAGYDTTAATLARMVQLLGSEEGNIVAKQLVKELNQTRPSRESTPQDEEKSVPESGIFKRYPLLYATFLESSRYIRGKVRAR